MAQLCIEVRSQIERLQRDMALTTYRGASSEVLEGRAGDLRALTRVRERRRSRIRAAKAVGATVGVVLVGLEILAWFLR